MSRLFWDGWLQLTRFEPNLFIADIIDLWDVPGDAVGPIDQAKLEAIGGRMVERRPDGVDYTGVPIEALTKLVGGNGRAAIVPIQFNQLWAVLDDNGPKLRHVMFVEGVDAVFYRSFMLPLEKVERVDIAIWKMMQACDAHQAPASWLMCWNCAECGGQVLHMRGKNRVAEYFTETINKDFTNIYAKARVPDRYRAKTCIGCGRISISLDEVESCGMEVVDEPG